MTSQINKSPELLMYEENLKKILASPIKKNFRSEKCLKSNYSVDKNSTDSSNYLICPGAPLIR